MALISKQELCSVIKEFEDKSSKKVALFGAGLIGHDAIEFFKKENISVICVADNNSQLWGGNIEGIEIINPSELKNYQYDLLIIANSFFSEVSKQLNQMGIDNYTSFFFFKRMYKLSTYIDPGMSPVEKALAWIINNQQSNGGVSVFHGSKYEYPEVTGYIIPTMIQYGYKEQALKMCEYLNSMINEDGSFNAAGSTTPYYFDTAQALRGLNAIQKITNKYYGIQRRAANYLFDALEENDGLFPKSYEDDSIVPETIMLFALPAMLEYAHLTNDDNRIRLVHKSVEKYLAQPEVLSIKSLTHFLAYQIDGLIDMGYSENVKDIIDKLLASKREDGFIPAFDGVDWVCITGCSQIAICLYKLGDYKNANHIMNWVDANMEDNGGFLGSVGDDAEYYPDRELSWAVKFYLDAYKLKIKAHFDYEFSVTAPDSISEKHAEVLNVANKITNGSSVLEVGCGKGRILKRIHEMHPDCKLYGVDISEGMLSYVPDYIDTMVGNIESLPYSDNTFDVVYSVECIEHSPNFSAAASELVRVCKPEGQIIIIDKQKSGWGQLETNEWERWPERQVLEKLLKENCTDVTSYMLNDSGDDDRDDLFIVWSGKKEKNELKSKLYFFGAGEDCRRALYYAERSEMVIDGIIDNNPELWGKDIGGIQIYSPEILLPVKKDRIIITVGYKFIDEIKEQLSDYGYNYRSDYFEWWNIFLAGNDNFGISSGHICLPDNMKALKGSTVNKLIVDIYEKNIYRLIPNQLKDEFKMIYSKCVEGNLFGKYIVNTELVDNTFSNDYELCFKHEYIPLFTYATEWSPKMFYDYTMFMIDFYQEIDKYGLCSMDGHAFNATFYNGRFVFFDFDAMKVGKMPFFYLQEFINDHIIVLHMMEANLLDKAYLYLFNPGIRLSIRDIAGYLSAEKLNRFNEMKDNCFKAAMDNDIQTVCSILREYIKNIELDNVFKTGWLGYQNELYDKNKPVPLSQKQKAVLEMVRSVKPESMIDLAGNMGWYSFELHNEVKQCITADLDYACVDFVFHKVIEDKIANILPVYMNIISPTPDYYKDSMIGNTAIVPWRKSAIKRFQSQMVLALAVIHHLVFSQQLTFPEVIGQLSLFSSKWLIVEFMEREDSVVEPALVNKDFDWYTKENFENELKKKFNILSVTNSEQTRILYLCEKKGE